MLGSGPLLARLGLAGGLWRGFLDTEAQHDIVDETLGGGVQLLVGFRPGSVVAVRRLDDVGLANG